MSTGSLETMTFFAGWAMLTTSHSVWNVPMISIIPGRLTDVPSAGNAEMDYP